MIKRPDFEVYVCQRAVPLTIMCFSAVIEGNPELGSNASTRKVVSEDNAWQATLRVLAFRLIHLFWRYRSYSYSIGDELVFALIKPNRE